MNGSVSMDIYLEILQIIDDYEDGIATLDDVIFRTQELKRTVGQRVFIQTRNLFYYYVTCPHDPHCQFVEEINDLSLRIVSMLARVLIVINVGELEHAYVINPKKM